MKISIEQGRDEKFSRKHKDRLAKIKLEEGKLEHRTWKSKYHCMVLLHYSTMQQEVRI